MRRAIIAFWALLLVVARPAHAEDLALPKSLAHLVVPDDWKAMRAQGVVAAYRRDAGGFLAVTRAEVPNPDAWTKEKKQAYADQVAAGIKASIPNAKKLTKKLTEMNGVPAVDVEAQHDGAPVVVRVLLFRTYALSCAIELPKGTDVAVARAIVAKFGPAKPIPKD